MKAHIVKDGVVTNTIEVESLDFMPGLIDGTVGGIGWVWDGQRLHAPAAPPPTVSDYTMAVQDHLDAKAHERNYDGILSACTYATSSVPKFSAEGQACVAWRDAVWATCYQILGEVESGQRPTPSVEDLIALLPTMDWPEVAQ